MDHWVSHHLVYALGLCVIAIVLLFLPELLADFGIYPMDSLREWRGRRQRARMVRRAEHARQQMALIIAAAEMVMTERAEVRQLRP